MNNTYTANSLPQQQQQQQSHQHLQKQNAPTATTTQSISYLPAHAHLPTHLNTLAAHDEQLANNGNAYFAARSYATPAKRYYTNGASTTATGLPSLQGAHNTILITNNFAQQNMPQNETVGAHNIHILSTTTPQNANNNNNMTTIDATTLRLPAGHFYAQQNPQFAAHLNNFNTHFATLQQQQQLNQFGTTTTTTPQHYFTEHLTNVDNNNSSSELLPAAKPTTVHNGASTNSTVVLDRINICINNHYNEALTSNNNIEAPLTCSTITTAAVQLEQQPSPVIPAIQHKATILSDSVAMHVIDEPDSTTTAHTPPITPINANTTEQIIIMNSPLHQSPSTTTAISTDIMNENDVLETTTIVIDDEVEEEEEELVHDKNVVAIAEDQLSNPVAISVEFKIGEDVLLQRQDNRFYLGTVIGNVQEQYLVRFDDQSEQWCLAGEMRKLGGGGSGEKNSKTVLENNNENNDETETPMCVSCKLIRPNDVVECCERCGRGYHRGCTTEVYAGSNEWLCKRCVKSMKVNKSHEQEEMTTFCRQLPYHVSSNSKTRH